MGPWSPGPSSPCPWLWPRVSAHILASGLPSSPTRLLGWPWTLVWDAGPGRGGSPTTRHTGPQVSREWGGGLPGMCQNGQLPGPAVR